MTPDTLSRTLEDFLAGSRHAVVLEQGARIYDLADAKYSISGEFNKCLIHFWSAERNTVRRVLDAELHNGNLRLLVQRLGQTRPSKLEICRSHDYRTPTARKAARAVYQHHLRRALERNFPGFAVTKLSNAVDLERSFGPIYARGCLRQGRTTFAIFGVNHTETQASIDAALTFGILWLDECRISFDHRTLIEGLKLVLPAGTSALTRERRAHLHSGAAKWQLYGFDERHDSSERAMLDVLTATHQNRLAEVELKADEDIHLPLQGLDYWSRVQWHHARGEFQMFGYFPGRELASDDPLLFLVAPTLHIHPATDTVLRYFAPGIEWILVGIDERWRDGVRVIFRKRAKGVSGQPKQRDSEEVLAR
jgi:hypothetical protein